MDISHRTFQAMGMEGMAKKQIFQQHRLIFYSFLKQAKRQESCVDEQYHYTAHLSHTKTYQLIRTELEKENIIRAVFIMRNPIESFLSQHRIQLQKKGKLEPQNEIDYLRKASKKVADKNRLRSNYPTTIDLLKSGLANEDVFIGLYETMFRPKERNRLCNYLYIKKKPIQAKE